MSIIIEPGHLQTAEVEFAGKHPDIFSTYLAASLVERLAIEINGKGRIDGFRADLNVQSLARPIDLEGTTPIVVNIGGQLAVPNSINLEDLARDTTCELLSNSGLFRDEDYGPDFLDVNLEGITSQSPNLNPTTLSNRFADSCVVYGHYIAPPHGIDGTFPALVIAQEIDQHLNVLLKDTIPDLRPDGKVHVSVRYTEDGHYQVERVNISIAHSLDIDPDFRDQVKSELTKRLYYHKLEDAEVIVNDGGLFDVYFLKADSGVSKAKDGIVVTGGIHQLGTDAVWGKCLYKASSTLLPYVFSLSKVVAEASGARYASVGAYCEYGSREAQIQLCDLDPKVGYDRERINSALQHLPKDRDTIRGLTGLQPELRSYLHFNDIPNFHSPIQPWKFHSGTLATLFGEFYRA
tara:strand:+ start:387 stop:1604 length:1218 start_codon:yes stop_codon:yes gene_type:complete